MKTSREWAMVAKRYAEQAFLYMKVDEDKIRSSVELRAIHGVWMENGLRRNTDILHVIIADGKAYATEDYGTFFERRLLFYEEYDDHVSILWSSEVYFLIDADEIDKKCDRVVFRKQEGE